MHLAQTVGFGAVQLSQRDRSAVAVEDAPRLQPVGSEIHKAAQRALRSDCIRNHTLVQAVLRRDDIAILGQMGQQGGECIGRMVRLDRKDHAAEFACERCGHVGGQNLGKLLDRPFDPQAGRPHGVHVVLDDIDHMNGVARARKICAQDATDGAGAPDQDRVIAHAQSPVSCARVSSTAMLQMRCMSASGFW